MNRSQRRAKAKKDKKFSKYKRSLNNKGAMFDLLPDLCSSCEAPYDKKDRKMVMSWNVVVREEQKIVRLYCPTCWNTAKRVISKNRET